MASKCRYRLGLDLGTNSIGWCLVHLNDNDDPDGMIRAGSRIFSDGRDPKTLSSLASTRREARQQRRRHDRVLKRQARFMKGLVDFGLMPQDDDERSALSRLDPYELRRKGLDQPLSAFEFGRALYHLAKRRGFKSSRKSKGEDEKEAGKIAGAIFRTRAQIKENDCRTFGEYLAKRHEKRSPVRGRTNTEEEYILYAQREMVADEFDLLWSSQAPYHPNVCTDKAREYLRDTLLFQRKLLPVKPGRCTFEVAESREPLWSPLQQQFRVLQELNNLHVIDGLNERSLSLQERNVLRDHLYRHSEMTFAATKKILNLPKGVRFNLESEKRKGLKGDLVSSKLGAPNALGDHWFEMSLEQQFELLMLIDEVDDRDLLKNRLQASPWSLSEGVAAQLSKISLPEGYGSLSQKALKKIVPILDGKVITYDKAAAEVGYHHSQFHTGQLFEQLPYYGEILCGYTSPTPKAQNEDEKKFGKIANPTVHVGLNQLRQLINAIVKRYGMPQEIVVELARDFGLSGEKRKKLEKEQTANQERNERLNKELRALGQKENRENRQRLMLWEELRKEDAISIPCVYSGKQIFLNQLFSDDEVEIDHILPFSKSLDDSMSNKILCTTRANRDKKNQAPYEAFAHSSGKYNWEEIEARAAALPQNKAKRFKEHALQNFLGENDFLSRHLNDTAYLSRVSKQYLTSICHPDKVWVSTGRLTALLRQKFNLNDILDPEHQGKNRNDHRHHAVDAAVIAVCGRSLISKISAAAKYAEKEGSNRLLKNLDQPWVGFRDDVACAIQKVVVSHKPDHGVEGCLHNAASYGKRGDVDKRGAMLVSIHKKILEVTDKNIKNISSPSLRQDLEKVISGRTEKDLMSALTNYSNSTGIRRVEIKEKLSVIPIHRKSNQKDKGQPYRYVKGDGNYCYDIYADDKGKWDGDVVSVYEANQPRFGPNTTVAHQSKKPLIMRLRKGDLLKIETEGGHQIMRVIKFSKGSVVMAEHTESNVDSRVRDHSFKCLTKSPSKLKEMKARVVRVDLLGFVHDHGFKET